MLNAIQTLALAEQMNGEKVVVTDRPLHEVRDRHEVLAMWRQAWITKTGHCPPNTCVSCSPWGEKWICLSCRNELGTLKSE